MYHFLFRLFSTSLYLLSSSSFISRDFIYVQCDECHGKRYNREALEIKYKNKTIADVLDMTVEQAANFFDSVPNIARKLQTLVEVGLGYIKLGQPATTFSGGEAQRIKLATELSKRSTGKTMYILNRRCAVPGCCGGTACGRVAAADRPR